MRIERGFDLATRPIQLALTDAMTFANISLSMSLQGFEGLRSRKATTDVGEQVGISFAGFVQHTGSYTIAFEEAGSTAHIGNLCLRLPLRHGCSTVVCPSVT